MKAHVGSIVGVVKKQQWEPVIVFSFSRKECEAYALALQKDVDFTTAEEKEMIDQARSVHGWLLALVCIRKTIMQRAVA